MDELGGGRRRREREREEGEGGEGARKKRVKEADDRRANGRMKLCANSPCMDSGEAGSLSIRPSASLAATKSATGASLVTSRYKADGETSPFSRKNDRRFQKRISTSGAMDALLREMVLPLPYPGH